MLQNPLTAFVPATTDEWSDLAVATLLDCYIDKHIELNRGSIRAKGWQDVIAKINSVCANGKPIFTYRRCKNKLDVMKRRFKLENDRKFSNGGIPSDWPWFQKMEEIMARNCMYSGIPGGVASGERLTPVLTRFHNGTIGFDDAEGERDSPDMAPGGAVQLTVRKEDRQETDKRFHSALCDKEDNKPNMVVFCDRARNRPENPLRCHEAKNRHNIPNGGAVADQRPSNIPGVSRKGCLPAGVSRNTFRKKRKNSCCSPGRQAREVARLVIEAFEKIELRRIEVMREMEIRRHETHLQIAKMIVDSNVQRNERCCSHQKESNNTDPKEQK